ncbi:cyclic nucleotide-binding domain-containing protein [Leptospira langatensis]|uniref:Cyclic nucleotide-binding domain-containing protein n=2 Tax=Leptospira langatensis TaxID=2484983 RepID=A0A5F1ZVF9_9LEPT|nr:cyclic nucleotide-binding domain-containing protein [Leptospira langatensis]TGK01614.1 cyclic nucleotide-binding domain-containing protein [Leptospira langatensis]TGL42440.1 cyclic nucleotide-binding domain-containing protein [Leptospira langatensis]
MATILDFVHSVFTKVYSKDSFIFKEGDESDGNMYFLFQGNLKVFKDRPEGSDKAIKELFPGEFFGELALISGRTRAMSVQVLSPNAKVGVLNKSVFEKLEKTSPQFLLLLLKNTFEKLNRAEAKLESLYAEIHKKEEEAGPVPTITPASPSEGAII